MTLMDTARTGKITDDIFYVAQQEKIKPEFVRDAVAKGFVVITKNIRRDIKPLGIGKGLCTKVNANIGTSEDKAELSYELEKLEASLKAKTDTVMDLSTGGDIGYIRREILKACPVPIGTVPIYEAAIKKLRADQPFITMTSDELFETIEEQAKEGVDFLTVHCGLTKHIVDNLDTSGRVIPLVSRGGAFITSWIMANKRENPLYAEFDRLLEIAREYEIVLSLGDGCRPGCIHDATDRVQIEELVNLGELTRRARKAGVQVMIEGPGHIPIHQVIANIQLEKTICKGAPFYVLGPIVTDVAPGYDHITSAIGGAIAAWSGADFLCYVTPSEHLALPTPEQVYEGVIATRIAAHTGDIGKGLKGTDNWDLKISEARANFDWESQYKLAMDEEKARKIRGSLMPSDEEVCTMCGKYCALKLVGEARRKSK